MVACRLLNFKMNHASIRMFDGVDYQVEKKKREEQLKGLMLSEIASTVPRRAKKAVMYTDGKEEGSEVISHRRIIRLPAMFNHQVCVVFS